jgi:hypothetical protein
MIYDFHRMTGGTTKGKRMSYSVKEIGKKADVVAAVNANPCVPEQVKAFIRDTVATIPDPSPAASNVYETGDSVFVEAFGHEPGQHTVKVDKFNAAVAPAPPQPA